MALAEQEAALEQDARTARPTGPGLGDDHSLAPGVVACVGRARPPLDDYVTSQSYVLPPVAPSLGGRTAVTATRTLAAWPHEDACAGGWRSDMSTEELNK